MKTFTFLLLAFFPFIAIAQSPIKLTKSVQPDKGLFENEKLIKFKFQQHYAHDTISEYSIVFFKRIESENAGDTIEFWGHGEKYLSIFDEKQIDLSGIEIVNFVKSIEKNYTYFNSEIKQRMRFYIQSDITVLENFIFSCTMDMQEQNFYFWINENKYKIPEKELLALIAKIKMYYNEDWVGLNENTKANIPNIKKSEKTEENASVINKVITIERDSVYGIFFNSISKNLYYNDNTLYYNDSLFNGKIYWKYKNGHFEKRGEIFAGKNEGMWEYFHKNGNLKDKGNFKGGKQDGLWEYYYEDGSLMGKVMYKEGDWNGVYKIYYKNGQIKEDGVYNLNQKVGDWKYFDETGRTLTEDQFRMRNL